MKRQLTKFDIGLWQPRTALGREVKEGRLTSFSEVFRSGRRLLEPEIVDALVPGLEEEILSVGLMQRMHKSGRRVRYRIVCVVGNRNGVVGVGAASAQEIGPAIRKAARTARLNAIEVARGCGSWECGCDRPHSVPFEVEGKEGSVGIVVKPAPRGLGLAAAEVPRVILALAGIKDAWTTSSGETRTTLNFAMATLKALRETTRVVIPERLKSRIVIGIPGEAGGETGSG